VARPPLNYEPPLDVPPQAPPPAPKPPKPPWWLRVGAWVRQEWQILTGKRW